jgi:flagellar hook-associated protein 2
VLTAKETGAANTIKITGTESFAGFNFDSSSVATPQSGTVNETQTFDPTNSTLKLKVGNATSNITLTGSNLSLSDISDQINAANVGVTASVSTEGGLSKLVFTPDNAGMNVSLTATGTLSALNNTASATGITQMTAAQDAKVVIDGVLVTSKTNEVTDAISGVTLTLNKTTTPDDEFKLDISNDKSTVQSNVSTFVNAYNSLMKSLTSMTAYNAETKVAGSLQGDSGARSMMEQLRATMIQAVTGNGNLSTLSSIGVSMQKDGTYAVDAVKLNSAATDSFEGLSKLLTADKGIISNLKTLVTDFLGDDGIITQRTASIQKSIDLNAKRQEEMYTRFTQKEARYTKQFNNLDFTLTNLQSLQSQLTSQLASLSSSSK